MLPSHRKPFAFVVACLVSLLFAPAALAAQPATVTVRVEGAAETVLPPTQVTTTTTPVVKEGHSCSGTSAAGALELATSGNWTGTWYAGEGAAGEFFVNSIESENYAGSPSAYWTFWLDNKPSSVGICGAELEPGASVLFFPECFGECPAAPNPLGIEAPAVAEVGKPLTVTVASYANASGARSAAVGAEVAYEDTKAITDSSGHATLTFAKPGNVFVRVNAPRSIRTETTVCVHVDNDGNCGTPVSPPAGQPATGGSTSNGGATAPYKGSYALVARVKGLIDGHVYARRHAPRILAGAVSAHGPVTAVSLELRREYRGRCWAYDGASERFRAARCGTGSTFPVATGSTFSYLLPAALGPGRYVLDVDASDAAGNHTTLARGTSRIVFYVR